MTITMTVICKRQHARLYIYKNQKNARRFIVTRYCPLCINLNHNNYNQLKTTYTYIYKQKSIKSEAVLYRKR